MRLYLAYRWYRALPKGNFTRIPEGVVIHMKPTDWTEFMPQLIYILLFICCPLFILFAALLARRKPAREAQPKLKVAAGERS
jgi:hypothetical protein